ncbi:MAG: hypothetical protein JW954_07905 [Dehalococcoidaceae bacterium]|nr:hypothetical protein [Dehalococcoidaceae bacterium]
MEPMKKQPERRTMGAASAKVNKQMLKLSGAQVSRQLGPNAKLADLQRYVSSQLADASRKATTAELLGTELSKAGNVASLHLSISWG